MSYKVGALVPYEEAQNFQKVKRELLETRRELEDLRAELKKLKDEKKVDSPSTEVDPGRLGCGSNASENRFSSPESSRVAPISEATIGEGHSDLEIHHEEPIPRTEKPWYFLGFPMDVLGPERFQRTRLGKRLLK